MAHFLEHLVFKGGEKYDHYRKVNETAERMGAVLNAYTSHDLVAFHITCRAEVVEEAIDLLTDFAGPPEDRRRRARPRARRRDPGDRALGRPAVGRGREADRPRGLRRPSARAARARPGRAPADVHARGHRRFPRAPVGGLARRRVPRRQPRAPARRQRAGRGVRPLPVDLRQRRQRAGAAVLAADPGRAPHVEPVAPADVLPAVDRRRGIPRTARRSASTPRCWAGRWARACSTRSASSAGSPTPSTPSTTRSPTSRSCSSPRAWTRASAPRRSRAWARSSTSCARTGRTRRSSSGHAPTPPAGASWRSRTPTRWRATRPRSRSSSAASIDPDDAIAALDRTSFDQVAEVARGISERGLRGRRRAARRRRLHELAATSVGAGCLAVVGQCTGSPY